jgi:CubicO group peptidase (beta-lactamase class C family)
MKFLRIAAMLLALVPGLAHADDRVRRIDGYFAAQAAAGGFNGNVLVAEGGRILYQRSFGLADIEAKRPNTADTEFEMASIGKVFTAIAVLQLAERGKIGLDQPFATYFPAFPYKAITIQRLLSHSSGLAELEPAMTRYAQRLGRPVDMRDLVPAIAAADIPLKLRPGEKWWYSNLGYQLLAHLVEVRSGQRFDAYLARHVLRPAGMTHTYLKTAAINRIDTPRVARNYDYPVPYASRRVRMEGSSGYYNEQVYGNARIVSTTGDMARLDRALRRHRLLNATSQALAYAPDTLADGSPVFVWKNIGGMGDADDALGWFVFRDRGDGRIVWHAGGMPGCVTLFMRNLDKDQMVIVFDNSGSEGVYKKGLSALRLLNGRAPLPTPVSLPRAYARTLMDKGEDAAFALLMTGKDDREHYALAEDELNNLALKMAEDGHVEQGLSALRAALGIWPGSDNLNESYGEVLEQAGRKDEAGEMYRHALRLNPANPDAKARLAKLERPPEQ